MDLLKQCRQWFEQNEIQKGGVLLLDFAGEEYLPVLVWALCAGQPLNETGVIHGSCAVCGVRLAVCRSSPEEEVVPKKPVRSYTPAAASRQSPFCNLQIHRIRFIDENRDHVISANESGKVIFEIMNEGTEPVYNVVPSVIETTGMKHIRISPSVMVERILPGNGIKYTATISAGRKLKNGNVTIRLSVTDAYGQEYAWQEFSLPTQK